MRDLTLIKNTVPIAVQLGALTLGSRYEDLPPAVIASAKRGILDYLAVTLAGSHDDVVDRLVQVLAPMGGVSALFGRACRTSSADAALINGTASHVLDFDDLSISMKGHPSGQVLSALFALSDEIGASGRDLLLSYVVGVELEARLGRALQPEHQAHGWHPTGTIGVFGATAACAKLLELTAVQTAHALATAASMAAGLKANFGTMVKSLHSGYAARNGVLAAKLGRADFTANLEAFEHRQGFLAAYGGLSAERLERSVAEWGRPFEMLEPGLVLKQYPCCASIHPALDATLMLRQGGAFDILQVERIEVWLDSKRLEHTNRPNPATSLDAKFSVQYCVARALADAAVVVGHFRDDAHLDPRIADLQRRIHAAPCVPGSWLETRPYGAVVRITLRDGRVLNAQVPLALGREVGVPLPEAQLMRKFRDCCSEILPAHAIATLEAQIDGLEALPNVSVMTGLVVAAVT